MDARMTSLLIGFGIIALFFIICFVGMRFLMPVLAKNPRTHATNYQGKTVVYGLGFVWLFWVFAAWVSEVLFADRALMPYLVLWSGAGTLALTAWGLGFVDDVYGTADARGFKGHLKALAQGRLTTGGLKLAGISIVSVFVAYQMLVVFETYMGEGIISFWPTLGHAILAGAAIALTANFLNLTDLRPGRASKVYLVLIAVGLLLCIGSPVLDLNCAPADRHWLTVLVDACTLLIPVIVVIGPDLREKAMLGDTGANPLGAIAGLFIVSRFGTNWWPLVIYVVIMLVLNLASEKISFSRVIAGNRVLSALDNLGRLKNVNKHD